MNTPNISYKVLFREEYMIKHFPEFVQFLKEKYPMVSLYKEMVYLHIHMMDEPPVCPTCGHYKKYRNSPAGYGEYCDRKCVNKNMVVNKTRATKRAKYGDENYNNHKKSMETNIERYGVECTLRAPKIHEKTKKTNLERYGVDNPFKSKDIQQKIIMGKRSTSELQHQKIKEKRRKTNIERYGVDNPMKSSSIHDKFKSTMMKRYGVEYAMLSEELNKKCSQSITDAHDAGKYTITHRKNNTFCTSTIEEQFASYLDDNHVEYTRQYRSLSYPFDCDFYIPQYDLYLEIQGTWTHGGHPFDSTNDADNDIVKKWSSKKSKYYRQAIYVWTELDPRKRKKAVESQINYLEIFSIDINEVITKYTEFVNGIKS